MIRMSKETDYAIVLLAYFAEDHKGFKRSAREVAMETQLPLPMGEIDALLFNMKFIGIR